MNRLLTAAGVLAAALQCAPARPASAASEPAASAPAAGVAPACAACPAMLDIPGGEFLMGSPPGDAEHGEHEVPQRLVRIKPFALGRTEVTVAQWRQFAQASGYLTEAERNAQATGCFAWEPDDPAWAWRAGRNWREPGFRQGDDDPVVCVSWIDAKAYLRWLDTHSGTPGWRLPTEAEWEYAARAGSTTRRPWGDDEGQACAHANGADRSPGPKGRTWTDRHACKDGHWYTAPVGRYRPNAWGLHDMLGNVWEWVEDCWGPYAGAPVDGSAQVGGECRGRVLRGGAWDEPPAELRSAARFWAGSSNRNNNIGLRVARTLVR